MLKVSMGWRNVVLPIHLISFDLLFFASSLIHLGPPDYPWHCCRTTLSLKCVLSISSPSLRENRNPLSPLHRHWHYRHTACHPVTAFSILWLVILPAVRVLLFKWVICTIRTLPLHCFTIWNECSFSHSHCRDWERATGICCLFFQGYWLFIYFFFSNLNASLFWSFEQACCLAWCVMSVAFLALE